MDITPRNCQHYIRLIGNWFDINGKRCPLPFMVAVDGLEGDLSVIGLLITNAFALIAIEARFILVRHEV